jgi:hypothetical protein
VRAFRCLLGPVSPPSPPPSPVTPRCRQFDPDEEGAEYASDGAPSRHDSALPQQYAQLSRPGSEVNRLLERAESLKKIIRSTRGAIVAAIGEALFLDLYTFFKQHADVDETDDAVRPVTPRLHCCACRFCSSFEHDPVSDTFAHV